VVLRARGTGEVPLPDDEAAPFEPLEPIREDVGGDTLRRRQKLREAALLIEEEIPQDEQRPAVPNEIERARKRAG
jgi:hypothetical protein